VANPQETLHITARHASHIAQDYAPTAPRLNPSPVSPASFPSFSGAKTSARARFIGDEVVVREGPLAGEIGTVVDDHGGCGKTIQVALSDGTLDCFGRASSRGSDDSDGSDSDGMSESKKELVDGEPEPGSCHASELESVSESEFEQACHDAWNASQQAVQVAIASGADNTESTTRDRNHKEVGVAQDGPSSLEPPMKRARAEVFAPEKLGNEAGETGLGLSLGAVGA